MITFKKIISVIIPMLLQVPPGATTFELQNSIVWLGENNVVYSMPKLTPFVEQTREEIVADMKKFKEIAKNQKVCLIAESNKNSTAPKKEDRDFIADQLESVVKAMAIVTTSAVSKMIANLFFSFKPPKYPVKVFSSEADAKIWLKDYL